MIKVIHVITDMKIGGAGTWLLNFLKNYDRNKLFMKVVVPKGSILKQEISALEIETIEIPGIGDKSLDIASVKAFRSLFAKERPDIVHTHASLSARLAGKLAGVKTVIHTKHCLDVPRKGMKKALGAFINNQLSSKVVAVSKAVEANLLEEGIPLSKISVIYGGVDEIKKLDKAERDAIRASYEIKNEDIVFGMVARLAEVKGHRYLLEAARNVLHQRSNIKFLIAGAGPLEEQLRKAVHELQLDKQIIFTGFIRNIEKIYNIIDVNVITSNSEALCLSLIEGMSLGKPMIGTAVGGVPELIIQEKTGLLVPAKNSEALAQAIIKLAEDPELRASMGMKAKELMQEKFSADKMAREIGQLYQEAVNRRVLNE